LDEAVPFVVEAAFSDHDDLIDGGGYGDFLTNDKDSGHCTTGREPGLYMRFHCSSVMGEEDAVFQGGEFEYFRIGSGTKSDVLYTNDVEIRKSTPNAVQYGTSEVFVS